MNKSNITFAITGAAGKIAVCFYGHLLQGNLFGNNVKIHLRLLEVPEKMSQLQGIQMQIEDSGFECLKSVLISSDIKEVFENADFVLFLGGKPREPGMERSSLLQINNKIFKEQGKVLNQVANKDVKVLVVANPSNTNCLTLMRNCPSIDKRNFTSLMQLDHNRARNQLAQKAGVDIKDVTKIAIWGNHSTTQYLDVSNGYILGRPIHEVILEQKWLETDLISKLQKRGGEILMVSGQTSAISAAKAVFDQIKIWANGTENGDWTSMGIITEANEYNIPEDICYSMPVICKNFQYEVVKGIPLNEVVRKKMQISLQDLLNEEKQAFQEENNE